MKNFPVTVNNKEYWISRSVAVVGFIFTIIDGQPCILAAKRGSGAMGEVGKWNVPCGYLDYDETLKEGCSREIYEETGLYINPMLLWFDHIDDKPTGRQNISISYWASNAIFKDAKLTNEHSEPNEVDEIKWIPIDQINDYDWAYGHKELIQLIYNDNKAHICWIEIL